VSFSLAPAAITVLPQPVLAFDYFLQRDVFSDDPFTPGVEPSQPFVLGLLAHNRGYGVANDLTITSAQPEIIENELGLKIAFELLGAAVNGNEVLPSLSVNLGDLPALSTSEAYLLMTSTLQGRFIDYKASFEYVNALGLKDVPGLSQLTEVNIHELTRRVRDHRSGADTGFDYLVNSNPPVVGEDNSGRDLIPDILYLSNGSTEPVSALLPGDPAVAITAITASGNSSLSVQAPSGWTYLRVLDPSSGSRPISAIRRADGSLVSADNYWITDRTFPENGRPTCESSLHILDYSAAGGAATYMVEFGPLTATDGTRELREPPNKQSKLNHAFLEVIAKDLLYEDWEVGPQSLLSMLNEQSQLYNIDGFTYELDQSAGKGNGVWGSHSDGFYAISLIPDADSKNQGAPPILAIRGSGDLLDWIDNIDSRGIGFDQFLQYRDLIPVWLTRLDANGFFPTFIAGHSLGGALTQWFASDFTGRLGITLGDIVTFNSPGINRLFQHKEESFGALLLDYNLAGDITHYISTGDFVSLLGREFVDGSVKQFSRTDFFYGPFDPHEDPLLAENLPVGGRTKPSGAPLESLDIAQFNSPNFNYSRSVPYTLLRYYVAAFPGGPSLSHAMRSRDAANAFVEGFSALFIDGLFPVGAAAFEYTKKALLAIGNLGVEGLTVVQNAVIATGNLGVAGLTALQDLIIAVGNLGVSGLQGIQQAVIALGNLGVAGLEAMQAAVIETGNLGVAGLELLQQLVVETGNLGIAGLEVVSDIILPPIIAIGNGGAAALEAMQNWSIDALRAASEMTTRAWQNAQNWTAATWQSTTQFTVEQWGLLTSSLNESLGSVSNFVSSTLSNIFNTFVTVSLAQASDSEITISYQ
jgi:hypothetical protein